MAELLLELFSEEIPARMQVRAADDLKRLVCDGLAAASLEFSDARAFVTPRRLTVVVDGLPDKQPDVTEERRGPRVDAPEKAIQGFLRGNGVTLEQCEKRDTGKGQFWFAVFERKGRATADVLTELLSGAIEHLAWPKSMRWGDGEMRWVRSLQRIVCLLDGKTISLPTRNSVRVGDVTSGHRFHAPQEFKVTDFADYERKLREAHVVLDREERKKLIVAGAEEKAKAERLTLKDDPALLDEVAGLVEWPVPLIGAIDVAFMELPPEVLETSMRTHQKYFSLLDKDGKPAPRFLVVANIEADDGGAQVVAGNERVLRARLADAKFFWDNDRRQPLESRVPALSDIIFHAKLGTLADKVARVGALAAELAPSIPGAGLDQVRSAATLAKADLTTEMVFEFPELQGIMGRYYALAEGEKPEVADAIAEHYSPLGPGDACPAGPVSVAVALADKIDTLVGFFGIDEKPTGSRDPFALRRAALGVIRLVLENRLRLSLTDVFARSAALYDGTVADIDGDAVARELLDFFADRLKVHLRERGVRHDLISAVFVLGDEDDLVRLLARVDALKSFLATDDGANLLVAYRRAANIVGIEERKDKMKYDGEVDSKLLGEKEESILNDSLTQAVRASAACFQDEKYDGAMSQLARLRAPIDKFFDEVTVNAEDPDLRANRLKLLSRIRTTMGRIADFSQIEG